MKNQNRIIIISGPSGAGEDSIIDGLGKEIDIERIITTTTRDPREGESDGNPYYFISKEEFKEGIENNKFFEYAKHYNDNYYGVTYDEIERVKSSDKLGIWKIDYKGVVQAKELIPEVVAIFVTAPNDILEKRIRSRAGVTDEYVADRMTYTEEWLKHTDVYDYEVVNEEGKLDEAIAEVKGVIEGLDRKAGV